MLASKLYSPTLREIPSDAVVVSHQYMLKAGMMRKVSNGLYAFLPLALRSVRKVEEIVKALSSGETVDSGGKKIKPKGSKLSEEYTLLQSHLCGFFGSKVQLSCTAKGKGKISIPFNNEEDLERIMEILDSLKKKE